MDLPENLRLSLGSAIGLGLSPGAMLHPPTTVYVMVGERCLNNCSFCTQARSSRSKTHMLSRITWPRFETDSVIESLSEAAKKGFGRVCLQCLNDPAILNMTPHLVRAVNEASGLPVSVSVGPMSRDGLVSMRKAGVDRIGIAIDGASREVFDSIKGERVGNPISWDMTWASLTEAVDVFGRGRVSTHLIVGMGESDLDVHDTMIRCHDAGMILSLFSYTPMKGTSFLGEPPSPGRYHALQLMRFSIFDHGKRDVFDFGLDGRISGIDMDAIMSMKGMDNAFRTRGCPDCNRPYYNERPTGPMYNYPYPPSEKEVERCLKEASRYVRGDLEVRST